MYLSKDLTKQRKLLRSKKQNSTSFLKNKLSCLFQVGGGVILLLYFLDESGHICFYNMTFVHGTGVSFFPFYCTCRVISLPISGNIVIFLGVFPVLLLF